MPHSHYTETLSDKDILTLLKHGVYRVDLERGEVFNEHGKELQYRRCGKSQEYLCVRLYSAPKMREIGVARLVWMAGTKRRIPKGFEVHHRNGDTEDNSFLNLFCLYCVDHRKLDGRGLKAEYVPF